MSKETELDNVVKRKEEQQLTEPPPLYKVVLNNDDYTPMEFVIEVLTRFFSLSAEKATEIMLTVHYKGKGVCGVFTRDIAETKATEVNRYAREHQHPLLCSTEKA